MQSMDELTGAQIAGAISSLGFFLFLSACAVAVIWSRTKEKLAIQETLRRLIERGDVVNPELVEALRRMKPRRSPEEIEAAERRYRLWGLFLVALGAASMLAGWRSDSDALRELVEVGLWFFFFPGLFCLAQAIILRRTGGAKA
jgi:hypothetical protein